MGLRNTSARSCADCLPASPCELFWWRPWRRIRARLLFRKLWALLKDLCTLSYPVNLTIQPHAWPGNKIWQSQQSHRLSMDFQPTPPQNLEIITALSESLTTPPARIDRTPNHFDRKLENTCNSPRRNVLLDTGFQAWFAYIRADQRTQAAVNQLSVSAAREVARNIYSVKPHPTVEAWFQHILYVSFRGTERRGKD